MHAATRAMTFLSVCLVIIFNSVTAFPQDQETDRHIIFLVDFSASVKQNIDNYWKSFELVTGCSPDVGVRDTRICDKIQPKDRVLVVPITGQSKTRTQIIADIYFPERGLIEGRLKYNKRTIPIKKEFRDSIKKAFTDPNLADNTEILSAVEVAMNNFKSVNSPKKVLIILSDMIEESEYNNFKKNSVDTQKILEKEIKAGRLADLSGVRVYISGASAASDQKFDEVRNFWMAYFEKTGAYLSEHDYYSSELLNFWD